MIIFGDFELNKIYLGDIDPTAAYLGDVQVYPSNDYTTQYLTFTSKSDNNTITFRKGSKIGTSQATSMSYSIDGGETWVTMTVRSSTSQSLSVTLNSGETVIWKGVATQWASGSTNSTYYSNFSSTGSFDVSGNIMSLLYGDNFIGQTLLNRNGLRNMFRDCTYLVNAENLQLVATEFSGNGSYSYEHMFRGCTSLTKAPSLLVTAPPNGLYKNMFYGCSSLTYVKNLMESNINENETTLDWLNGVAQSGTIVISSNTTVASSGSGSVWCRGTNGIPTGWSYIFE